MKEIHAVFAPGQTFVTVESEWQYDSGYNLFLDGLELPSYYEVDFCNEGDLQTVTIPGNAAGVRIPDAYFLSGKRIKAYTVLVDADGIETKCQVTINVRGRPERSDIQPTPPERLEIDELINALNDGVGRAEQSAANAAEYEVNAESSAGDSEAWAIGERNGVPVSAEDVTYNNNSRFYAGVAQQGAEESGYVWFDVDVQDGEMYVTITPNLEEDVSFSVNESLGVLEVTYG